MIKKYREFLKLDESDEIAKNFQKLSHHWKKHHEHVEAAKKAKESGDHKAAGHHEAEAKKHLEQHDHYARERGEIQKREADAARKPAPASGDSGPALSHKDKGSNAKKADFKHMAKHHPNYTIKTGLHPGHGPTTLHVYHHPKGHTIVHATGQTGGSEPEAYTFKGHKQHDEMKSHALKHIYKD